MRTRRFRVLITVAGLALFATSVRTQDDHRDQLPNFYKVNDALYRGGQPKPGGWDLLEQLGIKTVINLRDADTNAETEEEDALSAGLQYFNFPFERWGRPGAGTWSRCCQSLTILQTNRCLSIAGMELTAREW